MSNADVENRSLGDVLFELGWRQGALFSAPSARFSWNTLSDQDADKPIIQETRPTKPNEKFVLISQDCDIVASENDEPYVEAILCKPEKQRFVRKIGSKSARWFVIDANTGLVAYAKSLSWMMCRIRQSFSRIGLSVRSWRIALIGQSDKKQRLVLVCAAKWRKRLTAFEGWKSS